MNKSNILFRNRRSSNFRKQSIFTNTSFQWSTWGIGGNHKNRLKNGPDAEARRDAAEKKAEDEKFHKMMEATYHFNNL